MTRVNGSIWDLTRPLPEDCKLEFFSFEDPDGREVRRWHRVAWSSLQILGSAVSGKMSVTSPLRSWSVIIAHTPIENMPMGGMLAVSFVENSPSEVTVHT